MQIRRTWKTRGLPKSGKHEMSEEVLVTWIPSWNKNIKYVSIAVYVDDHSLTTEDVNWNGDVLDDLEYSETLDLHWIPSGWYETIKNEIEYIGYVPIDGEVIAWMKMLDSYHEPLTDISKIN